MHELAVTESILEIALRHGQPAQARKITDLYLVIGQLSSIVDDSVQFYWDFISKNTPAEGASFSRIPAEFCCLTAANLHFHRRYSVSGCSAPISRSLPGKSFSSKPGGKLNPEANRSKYYGEPA
jgi:Zn finger protein HypA/HybF involved in hydrogenase expression